MNALTAPRGDNRDGPLPPLLLILTVVTGLVDAVAHLKLGHTFVANMTGNIVFLGFSAAGSHDVSLSASLLALATFLIGALGGGRLSSVLGGHRGRLLAVAGRIKVVLVSGAATVAALSGATPGAAGGAGLIVLLALAMGLQNAVARKLSVPDMTTTVLTLTLTGLAADSRLAGGTNPRPLRRIMSVAAMLAGAAVGGLCMLHAGVAAALGLAAGLLLIATVAAHRVSVRPAPWAAPAAAH